MKISKSQNGTEVVLTLDGRFDTATSPDVEEELKRSLPGATGMVLDFTKVEYISSAGLRVLLNAAKTTKKNSQKLVIRNINDIVREVLQVSGILSIFTIE